MSQRNIDFGSFPDDPSADAIRSAFQKTQENFAELFAGLEDQAVLSVNRTPGAGITVNAPTGNVVVTANIACVQVSTSTLSIGISANGSNSAILTSTNQVLVIDLPNTISNIANITISGNIIANNVSVNANTTTQSLTVNANASANNISILNNITGNSLNVYDATVSNLLTVTGGFQPIGDVVSSLLPANTTINVGSTLKYFGNGYFVNLNSNGNSNFFNATVSNLLSVTGGFQPLGNVVSDLLPANTTIDIGNSSSYFGHGYFSNLSVTGNVLSNNLNANILITTSNLEATGNILANNVSVNSNTITNNLTVNLAFNGNTANLTGNLLVNNITNNNLIITNDLTLNANPIMAVGVITPTYGTQYLTSNISVTGTSSSNATTILSFTIPNQGQWEIDSQLISLPSLPPSGANLSYGIYYANGTLVGNSEILSITSSFGSPTSVITSFGKTRLTTSGAETLTVRGWAQGSLAQVLDYGANGRSSVSWLRLDAVATISTSSNVTFGNATVTGNLTAGNISGNITGNFSGIFANGTSNVAIPVPNGNVNISVGGVSNVLVATSTGINVAGTIQSTGNINTNGNLGVSGNAVISGNLTVDGNLIYVNVDQLDVEDPIINLQVGPNGAAPVSNSGKDVGTALNYFDSSAKIAFMGWDTSNAEIAFGSQVSISSEVVTFTQLANIRSGNANLGNLVTANYVNVANNLNVIGNISAANINGNITGNFTGELSNGTSNVNIPVVNANVNISAAGNANVLTVTGSGVNITGTLNVTGNANTGNLGTTTLTVTGNANTGNLGTTNLIVTGNITSGNANLGNLASANYITGTLTTGSQPNITSVGVLTSLMSSGNIQSNGTLFTNTIEGVTSGVSITAAGSNQNITLVPTGTGSIDVSGFTITNVDDPINATDATNKQYVDAVAQGLSIKPSCNVATTTTLAVISGGIITYNNGVSGVGATLTTTGSYSTIDSVSLTIGMRILVKDESTAANNGIYVLTNSTTLTRASDFDTPGEMVAGVFTFISQGSTYSSTGWVSTLAVAVVGTDPVNWSQFSGAGTYTAGTGLTLVGSQFRLANTGISPATYGNGDRVGQFTVNQQGQLTSATNVAITANAANLTGTTLATGIINSSLTSLGTLGALSVNGTSNLGPVSNLILTGGSNGQFIQTDGLGNLSFATINTSSLSNGNSMVSIPTANGNINVSVAGNANVAVFTGTGANLLNLNVTGISNLGNVGNVKITGGNANQILQTTGSGNLIWTDATGGYFLHTQSSPSSTWTIVHNLNNQYVSVEPVDNTGNSYVGRYNYPTVNYTNANAVTLTFSSAVTGYCAIVGGGFTYANGSAYGNSNVATFLSSYGSNTISTTGNIGGGNLSGIIRPTSGSGTAGIIFPSDPGGGSGDVASIKWYAYSGEACYLELNVQNDADDRIRLVASGGVQMNTGGLGVGTTPSGTDGEIRATNNITAYYSDDRLKKRLGLIENALDKVNSLTGFYYEANETAQELGYKPKREVGLSAQEVEQILPEVVAPAPIDDKYKTLHYERIIPLLVEAIKEISNEINDLKKNIGNSNA